ncbi:DUF4433 domain-containing protein [Streptomyces sp. NPDC013161]|uniref:DUF4433 domain-containing protein n=1 Tax=Streptomyces sp. NPDC013161 TaxID=3364862 RepID=UPI0036B52B50
MDTFWVGGGMRRDRVKELHYITPKENLQSIGTFGILSHIEAERLDHKSVAWEVIQDLRKDKSVPGGNLLHSYANLYFDARNPMMSKLLYDGKTGLVVLRVRPEVLDLPNVVITDGNAASGPTRFLPSPQGLDYLDENRVFAEYWTHADVIEYHERKRQRCAEVLVPASVLPEYINGCYTLTESDQRWCVDSQPDWKVEVNKNVYLR